MIYYLKTISIIIQNAIAMAPASQSSVPGSRSSWRNIEESWSRVSQIGGGGMWWWPQDVTTYFCRKTRDYRTLSIVIWYRYLRLNKEPKDDLESDQKCILFLISTFFSDTSWEFVSSKAPCGCQIYQRLVGWICKVVQWNLPKKHTNNVILVVEYCILNESDIWSYIIWLNMTQPTESPRKLNILFICSWKDVLFFPAWWDISVPNQGCTPLIFWNHEIPKNQKKLFSKKFLFPRPMILGIQCYVFPWCNLQTPRVSSSASPRSFNELKGFGFIDSPETSAIYGKDSGEPCCPVFLGGRTACIPVL